MGKNWQQVKNTGIPTTGKQFKCSVKDCKRWSLVANTEFRKGFYWEPLFYTYCKNHLRQVHPVFCIDF
jgi:hypothetical protein